MLGYTHVHGSLHFLQPYSLTILSVLYLSVVYLFWFGFGSSWCLIKDNSSHYWCLCFHRSKKIPPAWDIDCLRASEGLLLPSHSQPPTSTDQPLCCIFYLFVFLIFMFSETWSNDHSTESSSALNPLTLFVPCLVRWASIPKPHLMRHHPESGGSFDSNFKSLEMEL